MMQESYDKFVRYYEKFKTMPIERVLSDEELFKKDNEAKDALIRYLYFVINRGKIDDPDDPMRYYYINDVEFYSETEYYKRTSDNFETKDLMDEPPLLMNLPKTLPSPLNEGIMKKIEKILNKSEVVLLMFSSGIDRNWPLEYLEKYKNEIKKNADDYLIIPILEELYTGMFVYIVPEFYSKYILDLKDDTALLNLVFLNYFPEQIRHVYFSNKFESRHVREYLHYIALSDKVSKFDDKTFKLINCINY